MFKKQISLKIPIFLLASLFISLGASVNIFADICPEVRKQLETEELQRRVEGYFDIQFNTVSNIQFTTTNTGITFYNEKTRQGTGIWPRGSINAYIYGGGIWVGSRKRNYLIDSVTGDFIWDTNVVDNVRFNRELPMFNEFGDTIGFSVHKVKDTIMTRRFDTINPRSLIAFSYNPNTGKSAMVPGRLSDGDEPTPAETRKYRVFFSLDYSTYDGTPLVEESGPTWPIWDISDDPDDVLKYDRYFGRYVENPDERTRANYPRGPAFISGEDIFCTYKDTDLSRYGFGGVGTMRRKGYPQRIQYEQMIYSWGFGDYRDFVFIKYDQINKSGDTLWDMWLAPVYDVDITLTTNYRQGATNDITCFYGMEHSKDVAAPPAIPDPAKAAKNMAYQYSDGDMGEAGRGFGYCGFVFLESPAIITTGMDIVSWIGGDKKTYYDTLGVTADSIGFVRKDRRVIFDSISRKEKTVSWYPVPEQLGLVTFRNWPISDDKKDDESMYEFISRGWKDGPSARGDMRYMMATGPFHMRPMDTARTVVGLVIAATGKGGDADGTEEDLAELVRKVDFMQKVYDENFRAPAPPARSVITEWTPLNNGMMIKWDSTAEMSIDNYERGLSFMGYKIYRARRLNLDTFDVDNITGRGLYPAGKGPFGWKELKTYEMPTPFLKSRQPGYGQYIKDPNLGPRSQRFMGIDSMIAVGPVFERDAVTGRDTMNLNKILVMRIPRGVNMYPPYILQTLINQPQGSELVSSKLTTAGYYTDIAFGRYGRRINAVINSIDTSDFPWGKFYAEKTIQEGTDFDKTAKYYNPTSKSFLVDSVMLCTLELNPALAIINPLFYEKRRVNIEPALLIRLLLPPDSSDYKRPDVWIVRGDSVLNPVTGKLEWIETRVKIDTLYLVGTQEVNPAGNQWTISAMLRKTDSTQWLTTMEHYNLVMDSIYSYASKGYIKEYVSANFTPNGPFKTDFSSSEMVKNEVIVPFMRLITNNRTFIDVGDDPEPGMTRGDGVISESDDITKTERLFNNVEYHYKVIAYDEGDFGQPTPAKMNEGLKGLPNLVTTYPSAERAGGKLRFDIIHQDTDGKLGGLFNFNLFAIDEQRVSQLFVGDTIEVEFTPVVSYGVVDITSKDIVMDTVKIIKTPIGFYYTNVRMTNLTKDSIVLFNDVTRFESTPCVIGSDFDAFVDYSAYRAGRSDTMVIELRPTGIDSAGKPVYELTVGADTSTFKYPTQNIRFTTGNFRTKNFCYTVGGQQNQMMYGTLGLTFDAAIKQYGGLYRSFKAEIVNPRPNLTTDVRPLRFESLWRDRNPTNEFMSQVNNNLMPQVGRPVGNEVFGSLFRDTWTNGSPMPWNWDLRSPRYARFDNGPGEYEVEFLPGGEEDLTLYYHTNPAKTYRVKYLNVVVRDRYSYKRLATERRDVDSVEVRYPSDIPHMALPVQPFTSIQDRNGFEYRKMATPNPFMLPLYGRDANEFYRKFNLYAQTYINARTVSNQVGPQRFARDTVNVNGENQYSGYGSGDVQYVGRQGRYYLSTIQHGDTLDFVHNINIAGAQFAISYFQRGRRTDGVNGMWERYDPESSFQGVYGNDFAAGDKIILRTFGGASGFPEKGAKVRFAVSKPDVMNNDILDQIMVVPNPYVISHQGQKSAYDAKLYFTKLPRKCNIYIYTASGDLVTTIDHNEDISGEMNAGNGVAIFDLLTKNGQRVQSQTLIALIKTPCGAMTTKQFSVIVGGFRIID